MSYCDAVTDEIQIEVNAPKKVLVLDCDNTLWDGIVGEPGQDVVNISAFDNRGKIFRQGITMNCLLFSETLLTAHWF